MATIKEKNGSFHIRVYLGYDENNKQVERSMTWHPPVGMPRSMAKREADRQAQLFEDRLRNGQITGKRMKLYEFSEFWLSQYARPKLKARTVADYEKLMPRINESLGHLYIDTITPGHLSSFYDALRNIQLTTSYRPKKDVAAALKSKGFSKEGCARIAGIGYTVVGTACKGGNISYTSMEKLCSALEIDPAEYFEPTRKNVRQLSENTVSHYHTLLSSMLATAASWRYIPHNPCKLVEAPKGSGVCVTCLDVEDTVTMLALLEWEPIHYRVAVNVLLSSGLRRGELLALEWSDVNFQERCIHVSKSATYIPKQGVVITSPKTESSERTVYLPARTMSMLLELWSWELTLQKKLGHKWNAGDRVIVTSRGNTMHPDSLSRWFRKFCDKNGLDIHVHSLRHTYATLCLANNAPLSGVSGQLGHSTVTTTSTFYTHAVKSAKQNAVTAFEASLGA